MAQLVRAPPCHGGGRRFDPVPGRFFFNLIKNTVGVLAQLGEHLPYKQRVTGSSPVGPILSIIYQKKSIMVIWRIPEWPKGTDCKSAGTAFGGSNPPRPVKYLLTNET